MTLTCGLISKLSGHAVPLKTIEVKVDVQGYIATVISSLCYTNDQDKPVEAIFVFPLDAESAVYQFTAEIEGRRIIAECQEKEQARETYKDAIDYGQSAFLLEEDDNVGDVFRCKVGNIPPKTDAVVTFSYVQELSLEGNGSLKFVLPSVLNPRYNPRPTDTEQGAAITEPRVPYVSINSAPYSLEFSCTIAGSQKVKAVTSVKDALRTEGSGQETKVTLAEAYSFDHDITLLIDYEDAFSPHVVYEEGDPQEAGILKDDMVMLNFLPDFSKTVGAGKNEFIFIVDRSGSMQGSKMESAKDALLLFLKSLPVGCYFNIVSFGNSHSLLFPESQEYTKDTLKTACKLQKKMAADMGGTEILRALKEIYRKQPVKGYARQMFLLTDGEVWNTNEILTLVKRNAPFARVFTFGIGEGASTELVKGIARAGKGRAEFISGKDRLQAKVMDILKCAVQPSATDIQLSVKNAGNTTCLPSNIPPVLTGGKLVMYALVHDGKAQRGQEAMAMLSGTLGDHKFQHELKFKMAATEGRRSFAAHRLAAKAGIQELELNAADEEGPDIKQKVILLSTAANVVSSYTSFVGVDSQRKEKVIGDMLSLDIPRTTDYDIEPFGASQDMCCYVPPPMGMCAAPPMRSMPRQRGGGPPPRKPRAAGFMKRPKMTMADFDEQSDDDDDEDDSVSFKVSDEGPSFMALANLQNFDGSWDLNSELAATLGQSLETLRKAAPLKDENAWGTALALVWLEENFLPQKVEWDMMAAKARQWLLKQDLKGVKTVEDLLEEAKKLDLKEWTP